VAPAPAAPSSAAVQPAAPARKETFAHRTPAPQRHAVQTPALPSGPAHGTFHINAPVLGVVGTAAVRTDTVELTPTGGWASTSTFSAPTSNGSFALEQVVQLSSEGVVSANMQPTLPVADATSTQLQSSTVTTTPTNDGNVLVNVNLEVVTPTDADQSVAPAPPLNIAVQAVYTPDVTEVLAEQVTVVEGSAPCCESPASTTPHSTSGDDSGSASPPPAALGSVAVSPLSPTRRDDQTAIASS
jgi:hypothetical protein